MRDKRIVIKALFLTISKKKIFNGFAIWKKLNKTKKIRRNIEMNLTNRKMFKIIFG